MLTKTIKYVDYNGVERSEDFCFYLSRADIIRLQANTEGGLENWVASVTQTKDVKKLYEFFEELIKMSFGVKSPDGRRFIRNEELTKEFTESEAYSELIISFFNNPDELASFFNELVAPVMANNTDRTQFNVIK